MSGRLAGLVWDSDLDAAPKALAAMLADYARDDGTSIYPSVATMARRLSRTPRSVQKNLAKLRHMGILVVVLGGKGGRSKSTKYRLDISRLPARGSQETPANSSRFPEPNSRSKTDFHRGEPQNHESYVVEPRIPQRETTNWGSPEPSAEPSVNRKPRAQSRSARNRFDDGMEEKRRRIEEKNKRLMREEELRREVNVGSGPR